MHNYIIAATERKEAVANHNKLQRDLITEKNRLRNQKTIRLGELKSGERRSKLTGQRFDTPGQARRGLGGTDPIFGGGGNTTPEQPAAGGDDQDPDAAIFDQVVGRTDQNEIDDNVAHDRREHVNERDRFLASLKEAKNNTPEDRLTSSMQAEAKDIADNLSDRTPEQQEYFFRVHMAEEDPAFVEYVKKRLAKLQE
jgi:hypothetical protein